MELQEQPLVLVTEPLLDHGLLDEHSLIAHCDLDAPVHPGGDRWHFDPQAAGYRLLAIPAEESHAKGLAVSGEKSEYLSRVGGLIDNGTVSGVRHPRS
ncbi:hypothetical protein [Nonomuraea dietziae]|uniref:hypothetical protein n=1 Tax=Nonomuraea dietziae TaxID=65515 RepID=UPI0031E3949E